MRKTGTWTFWEKVLIDRSKMLCCFAAPAQLTVPSALRWGLVFEDEGNGVLALAPAVPRAWFAEPSSDLTVVDAPVSRQLLAGGAVSFVLQRQAARARSSPQCRLPAWRGKRCRSSP
eukprot:COSAG06_NODE_516_length_14818_cov_18.077926_6_plen_117_part_00